jgi:hypothetical protein
MTSNELSDYKRCFRKIRLEDYVCIYLRNGKETGQLSNEISSPLRVVGFFSRRYIDRVSICVESDIDYGFIKRMPEAQADYFSEWNSYPGYTMSPRVAGLLKYSSWITEDARLSRIARIIRKENCAITPECSR